MEVDGGDASILLARRRICLKRNASSESLLRGRGGMKQLRLTGDDSLPATPELDQEMADTDAQQQSRRAPYFEQLPRRLVVGSGGMQAEDDDSLLKDTAAAGDAMEAACRTGDEERVRWLLERCSLDPNMSISASCTSAATTATNAAGRAGDTAPPRWSPLLTACRYKHSGAARILLAHGANPNVRAGSSTPFRELLNGLWLRNLPDEAMILDLLDAGADPLDGLYRHATRFSDVLADYPDSYPTALPRLLEVEHLSAQRRGWQS